MLLKHVVQLKGEFKSWDGSHQTPDGTKLLIYKEDQSVFDEKDVLPFRVGQYKIDYTMDSETKGPFFYHFKGTLSGDPVETNVVKVSTPDSPHDRSILQMLTDDFRLRMGDDEPELNVILEGKEQYSNNKIASFLYSAMRDINSGTPKTNFSVYHFGRSENPALLIEGAMIFALIADGILQVRNQMDYSDSGLSIAMFNKTGQYQSWANFMLNQYIMHKKEFKAGIIPRSHNSGFVGISSEFGYRSNY